ncbi:MAG TPA: hypothetical protein VF533_24375 [Solirubrobacteraceae bacterium]|jgi:hypothetical protein
MTFTRWLPTFLAFPPAGYLAFETLGSLDGPVSAGAGGLLAGTVIGAAQWLALRSSGVGRRWVACTAAAMAAGTALAAAVTGAGTDLGDVLLMGALTGAAIGAAQAAVLAPGPRGAAAWTAVNAGGWPLAWLVSSGVIDLDRGWYVFGASGALVLTLLTGLTLQWMIAAPSRRASFVAA